MKKLFILFAVASLGFVACNNESAAEANADSTKSAIDSTISEKKDSVEQTSDSLKAKLDSTGSAAKDSVKAATGH
ncbi:MAG: entericidin [Chitinophagaceae bacterium]|nr:MAG: entericidin [Chitinophagaceae bacterium]